jgi:cytochrome c peroxidase
LTGARRAPAAGPASICVNPLAVTLANSMAKQAAAGLAGAVAIVGAALVAVALTTARAPAAAQPAPAGLLGWTAEERATILAFGPWPPTPQPDPANALMGRPAAQQFGRRLFFDARLSADGRFSCASCHVPAKAFQDGRPTASARRGEGPRNTPTLLDVGFQRWFGWGGSNDSLWAASLAPMLATGEMAHTMATLAARVRAHPDLARGWVQAVQRPLPGDDEQLVVGLAKALAAWQATRVSPRTPFDTFRDALARGELTAAGAYPLAAQRGLRLFIGEARCSVCHSGPHFSNGEFADIGLPFFLPPAQGGVDSGRHAGLRALRESRFTRLGPHHDGDAAKDERALLTRQATLEPRHFGEFRVPGLRQLVHTAPYWHDGSAASLADVLRHYSELNEDRLHSDGERILRRLNLTPAQAADLEAFLRSLSTAAPAPRAVPVNRDRPAASAVRPGPAVPPVQADPAAQSAPAAPAAGTASPSTHTR